MSRIESMMVRLFHIPLAEVLVDAKHGDHTHFELVTVEVMLSNGVAGVGYTYTGGKGGYAIAAMIEHDLAPLLIGRDSQDVEALYDEMQWHVHYVARGGIASFAISAIDIALWDIRGKVNGEPLWKMAGGTGRSCKAYCGGIDLAFSLEKLCDSVKGYLAHGFNGVKIKVGQPELGQDVERVKAVREAVGPDTFFMVDANYSMDVKGAIESAEAFKPYDILWFEEPIIPDEYDGFAEIADATGMPLAMGENLHTIHEFGYAFERSKLSYIQPDASNCGGITGFLQVAESAAKYNVPVCSHGMQELHVSLLSGIAGSGWLEVHSFPIEHYTHRPIIVEDHMAIAADTPGTGVEFIWQKLEQANLLANGMRRIS